jgi:hypothetical protein
MLVEKKRLSYDLESVDSFIEVKKRSVDYPFVFSTIYELNFFQKNANAYLYLVYEKDGKPKVKIFNNEVVKQNCRPAAPRYRFQMKKAIRNGSDEFSFKLKLKRW